MITPSTTPTATTSATTTPSTTTPATTTSAANPSQIGHCISSCAGLESGDYQSCHGCNVYASCLGGRLIDDRPCPGSLVWDDIKKRCEHSSQTWWVFHIKMSSPFYIQSFIIQCHNGIVVASNTQCSSINSTQYPPTRRKTL